MNYFALAGGIFTALIALYCLLRIVTVASGRKRWANSSGFFLNALAASGFGVLAAWLFSFVAG